VHSGGLRNVDRDDITLILSFCPEQGVWTLHFIEAPREVETHSRNANKETSVWSRDKNCRRSLKSADVRAVAMNHRATGQDSVVACLKHNRAPRDERGLVEVA
jgi:hypothetical protein